MTPHGGFPRAFSSRMAEGLGRAVSGSGSVVAADSAGAGGVNRAWYLMVRSTNSQRKAAADDCRCRKSAVMLPMARRALSTDLLHNAPASMLPRRPLSLCMNLSGSCITSWQLFQVARMPPPLGKARPRSVPASRKHAAMQALTTPFGGSLKLLSSEMLALSKWSSLEIASAATSSAVRASSAATGLAAIAAFLSLWYLYAARTQRQSSAHAHDDFLTASGTKSSLAI
mmetsp:Transcript_100609/g.285042  ORF Transcript_100609/g.285042 Transcript_100609/m.285042 type:complete len:228 (+) Transcript_100609:572-1255(+)